MIWDVHPGYRIPDPGDKMARDPGSVTLVWRLNGIDNRFLNSGKALESGFQVKSRSSSVKLEGKNNGSEEKSKILNEIKCIY